MLGPNPVGPDDVAFMLRRAFLLRACSSDKVAAVVRDGRRQIDHGLLRGVHRHRTLPHGARSMEAIIDMSSLADKVRYDRSSLPAEDQLALQVDAERLP